MEKIDNKIKYEGELDLNGLKIPCYVLEDGRRVLSTTGMQNVLGLDDPNDRSGTKLVKILSSKAINCLLYTSPSPRDRQKSRMPSSA